MSPESSAAAAVPGRRRRLVLIAVVAALAVVAAVAVAVTRVIGAGEDPTLLRTTAGEVRGQADDEIRRFQGVPYAKPPVGRLRWQLPKPVDRWQGSRKATRPGKACVQPDERNQVSPSSAEDCLYLNVTAPRTTDKPVPVMVWFHGGAFSSGNGAEYDPRQLVSQGDVAVVTVNSRLGVLGYFGHRSLQDSGTFGLADQQAALRWVRDNAAAFGGDPQKVTVFGNSSGGANICAHLASPKSKGLFQRAIVQSGSCRQQWSPSVMVPGGESLSYWSSRSAARTAGDSAAAMLGCAGREVLDCLRRKSPEELLAVNGQFLTMTYGTPILPEDPREAVRAGRFNRVPVLQGNTRDEHRMFARFFDIDPAAGAATYRTLVKGGFPGRERDIVRRYPIGGGQYGVELAWAAVATDSSWVCPTLRTTGELSRHVSTYSYEFADPHPPADPTFPPGFPTGSPHGSEVPYLLDVGAGQEWTKPQRALAKRMIGYWSSFARDGRPAASRTWPTWSLDRKSSLQLRPDGDRLTRADINHQCGFWSAPA